MVPDIVSKITHELDQPIHSERQVIYILVELRKLLESKGLDRDIRYRALIFCCDWAVHPKLDRESARAITSLFDQYEASYRVQPVGVSQAGIPGLVEFCDHIRMRWQLAVLRRPFRLVWTKFDVAPSPCIPYRGDVDSAKSGLRLQSSTESCSGHYLPHWAASNAPSRAVEP